MSSIRLSDIKNTTCSALLWTLVVNSPILSGSMQMHIQLGYGNDGYEVIIEAPFYDMKKWEKNKTLVYTGETKNGFTDYAQWVNEAGGFGKHNKSEHWVNRVVNEVCRSIAIEYGGIVEGELEG